MNRLALRMCFSIAACLPFWGCGQSAPKPAASKGTQTAEADTAKPVEEDPSTKPKRRDFKPIEIASTAGNSSSSSGDPGERVESARAALKPLQILIGNWTGTSRNARLDEPNWAWDLKTDPKQPSLRIKSEKGQYIRDGRLTFLPISQEYEMTATDGDGVQRVYRGKFSQEVQDVPGDDKKLQRTYKLELIETPAIIEGEQWKIVINQQENNRYILELDRKRGNGKFQRIDTVNTQREGTSFAVSDSDYGEKTCVVSQGLGTTAVTHKGKTYWVCCSGCKSAFEDDPDRWVAKFEALMKDKMKN